MQEFKTAQKDEQEISYMLAGARKNGTIAALVMSFSSLLSVAFLFFANNLPQLATQKTVGFKQIFSLIAVIISIYFYYKALKTISNLSGSNALRSYQKFIASCIFIIALYTTLYFTQANKTTLYAIFALVIIVTVFGLTMWLKIHYNLAQITENKIFKIYATSSIVALILIIIASTGVSVFIFFTYMPNPNEAILMQLKAQTYMNISAYIVMLGLNFILLFAWIKVEEINLIPLKA